MSPFLADVRAIGNQAILNALRPRRKVDYEKWAVDNVSFSDRESQFPGPYNPNRFKPFTEIYKALGPDDPCRIVTISKGAQIGGTIIATVFTLGTLDLDPGDFLYVHPTEENARRWSKLKLSPLLRGSARLREIFPEKARDGADSVMFKERYDQRGSLLISGANSAASLSQVSMRRQVQDDLAEWVANSAGDPEGQADSRSSAFDFAKILKSSTPLVVPGCRITSSFENGTREHYHVPCPHCDYEQTLEIENFLNCLDEVHPERSAFSCIECGALIEEHRRDAIVRKGRWVAQSPEKAGPTAASPSGRHTARSRASSLSRAPGWPPVTSPTAKRPSTTTSPAGPIRSRARPRRGRCCATAPRSRVDTPEEPFRRTACWSRSGSTWSPQRRSHHNSREEQRRGYSDRMLPIDNSV